RVERQWVAASDVVDAALAHVRHALEGHAVRVDADMEMEVEIDPRLTSVALSHILENAAQYSPTDREILIFARVEPDGLHVSVTDLGPGLDPGELDHLFERFYRGRSARQLTFGTGMGLSTVISPISSSSISGSPTWTAWKCANESAKGQPHFPSWCFPRAVRKATRS